MRAARTLVGAAASVALAVVLATVALSPDAGQWKLVLIALALGVPGALCAVLQPHNRVGWLLLAVGVVLSCLGLATRWVESGHASAWASWASERSGAIVVPLTFLALVLMPDGQLPSPRWRPAVVAVVVGQVAVVLTWSLVPATSGPDNPVGVLPGSWAGPVGSAGDWVLQLPFLLAVAAVVVRLRRHPDRARLAPALGGAAGFAVLALGGHVLWPRAADALDVLGAMLLGAGITLTLLRQPEPAPGPAPAPPPPETPGLSGREREVLELVAEGLTNRQIAERLFISPVTARNHVSRILTKLGLENRTQAATWLARQGAGNPPSASPGP
ncbi:helix-turn-helix transcriptional regulator [Nocardioides euryhalodurans]|nr:response regulator transcription factor [Nocardioides euryhalodurans]